MAQFIRACARWACCVMLMSAFIGLHATPSRADSVDIHLPAGIAAATRTGNLASLRELERTGAVGPNAALIFANLIQYNINGFLTDVRNCESTATRTRPAGWQLTALSCNELWRHAAISQGDARQFLVAAGRAKEVLFPAAAAFFGKRVGFDSGLDGVDLASLARTTPALSVGWTAPMAVLPLRRADQSPASAGVTVLPVGVDGVKTDVVLSPSNRFLAPLTFVGSESQMRRAYRILKLRLIAQDVAETSPTTKAGGQAGDISLALAERVVVGPLSLGNVAVMLVRSSTLPPGVYMGLSLLRRFGSVEVGAQTIALSRAAGGGCGSGTPMTFASDSAGGGELVFSARLNGRTVSATWNPLSNVALQVERSVFAAATGTDADRFTPGADPARPAVDVEVGDARVHPAAVEAPVEWRHPYQMVIGRPPAGADDVYLDFAGPQPTIQFCAAGAAARTAAEPAEKNGG